MKNKNFLLGGLILIFSFYQSTLWAAEALQVLPTRVVLAKESSAELTLVNKGDKTGNFRVLLRNLRTDENGVFEIAEDTKEGEKFADKMVRFSPRRVGVEGGEFQKVRVMVRKSKKLEPGEYRTHMVFQTLPDQTRNTLDETAGDNDVDIGVQPIVEVSIPIIVRHGKLNAELEITSAKMEEDKLKFKINRNGSRSVYGDAEVFINSGKEKGKRIGYVRGIAIYYPNSARNISLPLKFPDGMKPGSTELLIRYTEDPTYGGNLSVSKTIPTS